ncbi:helix-turn-helix domain-containing protein [Paenibacillus paeoniae]|uniref:Helix-turn-helix domain-containing protein n=1 Tax=Paenibacillus paeoniae TaxID=2292705 RepID=A0A371PGP5_9BACL|nr:helix-turn-helix domain-containing protein [Paenibacillus paeoniae]REK75112.1 helix-turn-helix domain-containing protein [Paenibacillus paeoniae]
MNHSGYPVLKNMSIYADSMETGHYSYHQATPSLVFIHAHAVTLTINDQTHALKNFGCLFLPQSTTVTIQWDITNNQPVTLEPLCLYACSYEWICEEASTDTPPGPVLAELSHSNLFDRASALFDAYDNKLYNSLSQRLPIQAQFLTLFADASWELEQPQSVSFVPQLDGMEQVITYLHNHYDRKIGRDDAVDISGLSLRQFTASFKQRTGFTFNEYLNRIRIDKVKAIMLQSRSSLNEVARQVGYSDEFYLSRKFKQVTGMSPTIYLRKPHKIASMDHAYTLDLLSLGVTPCAAITDTWVNNRFRLPQSASSFQPLYWQTEPSRRLQILQHIKPDIILHPMVEDDEYQQIEPYRHVGLVIQIPWRGIHWKQHFMSIADITGMEQQARNWLDYFDHRSGQVREALRRTLHPRATVAIINVRSDRTLIYAYGYMGADLLYDTLQLTPPQAVTSMRIQGLEHPEFSIPELVHYDADHYFVSIENNQAARLRAMTMMNSPEWLARTAVKQQCVYQVDMTKWYGYGPAALDAQLDDVMNCLLPKYPKKHRSI